MKFAILEEGCLMSSYSLHATVCWVTFEWVAGEWRVISKSTFLWCSLSLFAGIQSSCLREIIKKRHDWKHYLMLTNSTGNSMSALSQNPQLACQLSLFALVLSRGFNALHHKALIHIKSQFAPASYAFPMKRVFTLPNIFKTEPRVHFVDTQLICRFHS